MKTPLTLRLPILIWSWIAAILLLATTAGYSEAPVVTVTVTQETGFPTPVCVQVNSDRIPAAAGSVGRFQLTLLDLKSGSERSILAQFETDTPGSTRGTLWWMMPPTRKGQHQFRLEARATPAEVPMRVEMDSASGQLDVTESGRPVLRYNYQKNEPGDLLARVSSENVKYARARSDYIHPLFGLHGEELTKDWSVDHPHHRGIYWAWPEVDYGKERGDLHALQRVFARPTGNCQVQEGILFARIDAENLWKWEDREPIVHERAIIRAWRTESLGRLIDLEFQFTALVDGITVARRETRHYGGLNIRLAPVNEQQILFHTDPEGAQPRRAFAELAGLFSGSKIVTGLVVFQNPANPDYPGDWIKYPELNWFQPTFPAAGTRYVLRKDRPLVLKYRLWIHDGPASGPSLAENWSAYAQPPAAAIEP